VVLLSDDVHFYRASLLRNLPLEAVAALRKEELALYRASDAVAVITHEDAQRIRSSLASEEGEENGRGEGDGASDGQVFTPPAAKLNVRVVPMVAAVIVEAEAEAETEAQTEAEFEASWALRGGVVTVGNGANPTNAASVAWFVRYVWPLARQQLLDRRPREIRGDGRLATVAGAVAEADSADLTAPQEQHQQAMLGERDATFTLIGADWDPALANVAGVEVRDRARSQGRVRVACKSTPLRVQLRVRLYGLKYLSLVWPSCVLIVFFLVPTAFSPGARLPRRRCPRSRAPPSARLRFAHPRLHGPQHQERPGPGTR
jgi:hypothetical protein